MKKFFLIVLSFSFLTSFILADENSMSADEKDLLRNFRALSSKDQKNFREQIKRIVLRNKRPEVTERKDLEFPFGDLLFFGM